MDHHACTHHRLNTLTHQAQARRYAIQPITYDLRAVKVWWYNSRHSISEQIQKEKKK